MSETPTDSRPDHRPCSGNEWPLTTSKVESLRPFLGRFKMAFLPQVLVLFQFH